MDELNKNEYYLDMLESVCNDALNELSYPYVYNEYEISHYHCDDDSKLEEAREAISRIGESAEFTLECWDKSVKRATSDHFPDFMLFEINYRSAIAISLAIKMFVCDDVRIMLSFQPSKWTNKVDRYWVLSNLEPEGKFMSKAAYSTYKKKMVFPLMYSLKFDSSEEDHAAFCAKAEELSVGQELKISIVEEYEGKSNCLLFYTENGGLIGYSQEFYDMYLKAIKSQQKRLKTVITELKPLSKRTKGTKNPLIKVLIEFKQ